MKIMIDIDEEYYEIIKHDVKVRHSDYKPYNIIANGIPLPKGHGRLIDGDKVLDDIEKQCPASVSETDKRKRYARLVYYWAVKNAPTIIEAEVSENEKTGETVEFVSKRKLKEAISKMEELKKEGNSFAECADECIKILREVIT